MQELNKNAVISIIKTYFFIFYPFVLLLLKYNNFIIFLIKNYFYAVLEFLLIYDILNLYGTYYIFISNFTHMFFRNTIFSNIENKYSFFII
ncbi:hypothetical protein KQ44_14425 [Brachyspira sp. G79]|nr:hypothetical protein KQ44_14425 [Brachyspira sp. G79]